MDLNIPQLNIFISKVENDNIRKQLLFVLSEYGKAKEGNKRRQSKYYKNRYSITEEMTPEQKKIIEERRIKRNEYYRKKYHEKIAINE